MDGIGYIIIGLIHLLAYMLDIPYKFTIIIPICFLLIGFMSIILAVHFKNELALKGIKEFQDEEEENLEKLKEEKPLVYFGEEELLFLANPPQENKEENISDNNE